VKSIDGDLVRWRELEQMHKAQAAPVVSPLSTKGISPYSHVSVLPNVEPGIKMARFVIARIAARYEGTDAVTYAEKRWNDSTPEVALALKAAVAAGTTTDATWAKPLVNPAVTSDFLPLLRAATILGKIEGLRKVPFNVNVPAQTAGGVVSWVGELKPKPVSAMAFAMENIAFNKVAAIVVLSQELVRFSNPSAEAVVRDSLVKDIAKYLDEQFINPAVAAVAGVNPASITNGAPTAAATTNPLADILGLINHFATNNIPVDGLTFLLSPANALALSFRTNLDGSPEFPGIGINGGTYKGLQFITSNTLTTNVVALAPQYILFADDGGVTIDASTEASLQMDSAPVSPVVDTTVLVSMFQMNAVALRAERYISWKRVGTNTVKYLTATAWPSPTGATAQTADGTVTKKRAE
jgi:HK97 family phage major capsid protein